MTSTSVKINQLSQFTLGKLIEFLQSLPPDAEVANLRNPHSYRGYYEQFAFELHSGTRPVAELLQDCQNSVGEIFEGWKGGDFKMDLTTLVWAAKEGSLGDRLVSLNQDGSVDVFPDYF